MDAESDTGESTRPRGSLLTIDTLLSSFLLPLESDAPQIQQTYMALPGFFTFFTFSLAGSRGGQKYS